MHSHIRESERDLHHICTMSLCGACGWGPKPLDFLCFSFIKDPFRQECVPAVVSRRCETFPMGFRWFVSDCYKHTSSSGQNKPTILYSGFVRSVPVSLDEIRKWSKTITHMMSWNGERKIQEICGSLQGHNSLQSLKACRSAVRVITDLPAADGCSFTVVGSPNCPLKHSS